MKSLKIVRMNESPKPVHWRTQLKDIIMKQLSFQILVIMVVPALMGWAISTVPALRALEDATARMT